MKPKTNTVKVVLLWLWPCIEQRTFSEAGGGRLPLSNIAVLSYLTSHRWSCHVLLVLQALPASRSAANYRLYRWLSHSSASLCYVLHLHLCSCWYLTKFEVYHLLYTSVFRPRRRRCCSRRAVPSFFSLRLWPRDTKSSDSQSLVS